MFSPLSCHASPAYEVAYVIGLCATRHFELPTKPSAAAFAIKLTMAGAAAACCKVTSIYPVLVQQSTCLSVSSSLTRASVRRTGKSQRHVAQMLPHAALYHSYPQPSLSSKVDSRPNEQVQCKRRTTRAAFCCLHNHQPQHSSCPMPTYMYLSACLHPLRLPKHSSLFSLAWQASFH